MFEVKTTFLYFFDTFQSEFTMKYFTEFKRKLL